MIIYDRQRTLCTVHDRHIVLFVTIQNSSVTYEISFVTESFLFLHHVLIHRKNNDDRSPIVKDVSTVYSQYSQA